MRFVKQQLQIPASDLAKHLACRHLTSLDLLAARGEMDRPHWQDPALAVLQERGFRHEAAYLAHLKDRGHTVVADEDGLDEGGRLQRTINAMRSGIEVIAQADLKDGNWRGRADVLIKVDRPSDLGNWSYEVVDTKLARETRGGTILQLCLYSELVAALQGRMPERIHVVAPEREFEPEIFRLHDFMAYYRFVKGRLEEAVADGHLPATQHPPNPVDHCDICSWWPRCNDQRRSADHLSFVAGISKLQMCEVRKRGVNTLEDLASMSLPLPFRPERGASESYVKIRE